MAKTRRIHLINPKADTFATRPLFFGKALYSPVAGLLAVAALIPEDDYEIILCSGGDGDGFEGGRILTAPYPTVNVFTTPLLTLSSARSICQKRSMPSSLAMRSSTEGWVLKRMLQPFAGSGLTIKRCAVAGAASRRGKRRMWASIFLSALAR